MDFEDTITGRHLERVPRRPPQCPVIVLKFGGTAVGSTPEAGRIKRSRTLIGDYLERGYYVVPVFSAYRRGRSGASEKVSITDHLQNYKNFILKYDTIDQGVEAFAEKLWQPHRQLMEDLHLADDASLQQILSDAIDDLSETAGMCCRAKEQVPSLEAHLITGGERLSTRILAAYLNQANQNGKFPWRAEPVSALELGIVTDSRFLSAHIDWERAIENAREVLLGRYLDQNILPVVTGFDGIYDPKQEFGDIMQEEAPRSIERRANEVYRTCLGRGGSDLTATFLGLALEAEFVGFAKETSGVLTGDDMIVGDTARTIPQMDYDLATEAGNIYSKAVEPVRAGKIPVHIFDPNTPEYFTAISDVQLAEGLYLITHPEPAINVHVRTIPDEPGGLVDFLHHFAEHGVDVAEVRHQKAGTDCFVLDSDNKLETVLRELGQRGYRPQLTHVWYIRVIGNITPQLAEAFNQFVDHLHAHASASYQFGTKVLTATLNRNRVGSPKRELKRIHEVVKRLHDELILPQFPSDATKPLPELRAEPSR